MYPDNGESPWLWTAYPGWSAVFDLITTAGPDSCWRRRREGILTASPAGGPRRQKSSEQFTGQAISQSVQDTIVAQVGAEMENWVLIGMPGCGKTRIGQLLAQRTGRPLWMETESWRSGPNAHSGVL